MSPIIANFGFVVQFLSIERDKQAMFMNNYYVYLQVCVSVWLSSDLVSTVMNQSLRLKMEESRYTSSLGSRKRTSVAALLLYELHNFRLQNFVFNTVSSVRRKERKTIFQFEDKIHAFGKHD